MEICPSALTAAALFIALVIMDLIKHKYRNIPLHAIGGFFCILGLTYLCSILGDLTGWILLSIPVVVVCIGLFMMWLDSRKTYVTATIPAVQRMPTNNCSPCIQCGMSSCGCFNKRRMNRRDDDDDAETEAEERRVANSTVPQANATPSPPASVVSAIVTATPQLPAASSSSFSCRK
jgi:hypothetical protein